MRREGAGLSSVCVCARRLPSPSCRGTLGRGLGRGARALGGDGRLWGRSVCPAALERLRQWVGRSGY